MLLLPLFQLLLDRLFLDGGQVLGLCLLETGLDGQMEAMIQDTVMGRRSRRRNVDVIVDVVSLECGWGRARGERG